MDVKIQHNRYMILGSINGILGILGVVIGASASGDSSFIINAALAGAVALALANGAGSYLVQGAIEYRELSKRRNRCFAALMIPRSRN